MKTYDIHEAAEFLKIDRTTALELAGSGELSGAKVGRSWVFLESDLIEYLHARVRRQTNERRELVRTQALATPGNPTEVPSQRRRRRPPPSLDDVTVPASPPATPRFLEYWEWVNRAPFASRSLRGVG
jgi:excisionase family DNA binding protein